MSDSLWEAAMDRFVNRQNIERYRRLADETTNATERLRVIKLLAEERAKFKLELKLRRGATVRRFEPDREEQRGAD
jgi:coproporphyrinogen III oxidase-like Fe-S oxidoreductase